MLYNDSTASTFATIDNVTDKFDTIFPNDIFLSTIEMRKNEQPILSKFPVSSFQSPVYGYRTEKELGCVELQNPKFFKSGDKFDIKMTDKPTLGGTAGTGWTYTSIIGILIK